MDTTILIPIIAILFFVVLVLLLVYWLVKIKQKSESKEHGKQDKKSAESKYAPDLSRTGIHEFMEFDEVKDSMIIRKDRKQYVMVLQCQGVNYDLLSEEEKIAVEEGFVQFLNILRFPIQLYVQTRSLNLRSITEEYKNKIKEQEGQLEQIQLKLRDAGLKKNEKLIAELKFQEKRKRNVLEYTTDITEYISKLSLNNNVLQQKTYVIVSYYAAELGTIETYAKEEVDAMCFAELYTRSQAIMRSLGTSGVSSRVLDSEELAELLYVAYNRDDEELIQLSNALDAEYDALYNIGKDILEKKKQQIEEKMDVEAAELASDSLIEADDKLKAEKEQKEQKEKLQKAEKVKKRAINLVEQYKDNMSPDLYQETKEIIAKKTHNKQAEILGTEATKLEEEELKRLSRRTIKGKKTM